MNKSALIENAVWSALGDDLRVFPIDTSTLISHIQTIRDKLAFLNKSHSRQIHENIDIEFIDHLISHNVFGIDELSNLVNFIVNELLVIVDKEIKPDIKKWKIQLNTQIDADEFEFSRFVPHFIRKTLRFIEFIELLNSIS